ncbi:MAG TPA: hypothetical protein VM935_00730, partial [Chitinophagaceae bacterium]|nr:hypothetical protein [Chitinophagaceae bacterium]
MRIKKFVPPAWYVMSDYVSSAITWALFFKIREALLIPEIFTADFSFRNSFLWIAIFLIPLGWLVLYALIGSYTSIYKKSRFVEFINTLVCTAIGCIALFFFIVLDDFHDNYTYYYQSLLSLIAVQFSLSFLGRLIVLNIVKQQINSGIVYFNAAFIGPYEKALGIYNEAAQSLLLEGYKTIGFISTDAVPTPGKELKFLGHLDELEALINSLSLQMVIIAIDRSDHTLMDAVIQRLSEKNVEVRIQPNTWDILSGSVKTSNVLGPV